VADPVAFERGIDPLLEYLKNEREFDFTGYKRSTVERRVAKRMEEVGLADPLEYIDYLTVHPDEFESLFNTILINVTSFFRDAAAWDYLATEIVPRLTDAKGEDAPIRVWNAGCATGEEPLTLAMVLVRALGADAYERRVKIYATDVDEEALAVARMAIYPAKALEAVPEQLRREFFERHDQRYAFRKDSRRPVIFGRNDLVQDAPISRVDLLLCRNTLMYFNVETQSRILQRFHFALNPGGFLFVGKSEMLVTHSDLFVPVSLKQRVFTKVLGASPRDRLMAGTARGDAVALATGETSRLLRESALEATPVAQLVLDPDGTLLLANQRARKLLGIGVGDLGRPIQDLEASYRPIELRSHLDELYATSRPRTLPPVTLGDGTGGRRTVEVHVDPLRSGTEIIGASVTYVDLTRQTAIQEELERSRRELGNAYEELQTTVEELETTNEELQSTVEELETTNEELQSTNEELETMNEELQSGNEELETINDALRERTLELNEANALTEAILASMGIAIVVVDGQQQVRIWNRQAEQLWGTRADEAVGEHVLNLDIGMPLDRLGQPIRETLAGATDDGRVVVNATDRRGRAFKCRVTLMPLAQRGSEPTGVIVLMERAAPG